MLSVVQQECPAVRRLEGRGVGSMVRTLVLENVKMAMDYGFVMMVVLVKRK